MAWPKVFKFLGNQQHRRYFGREESKNLQRTIIVPLYIYPAPGAWEPLYESIQKYPSSRFLVIINPGNGPGADAVPDANYLREIPKLTRHANVDVVGYVHTTFAQRNITAVIDDIDTYSKWTAQAQHPGLEVHGIFVDETPNQYDARAEAFLKEVTEFAKSRSGIRRNKLVVHNPGCAASPAYMTLADLNVVFEDTMETFNTRYEDAIFDADKLFGGIISPDTSTTSRDKLAVMIHSVPRQLTSDQKKVLIGRAKAVSGAVFVTDLDVDYYSSWSPEWTDWVRRIGSV